LDTVLALKHPADYSSDQGVHFEKARGVYGDDARSFEAKYEVRDGQAMWSRTEIADVELTCRGRHARWSFDPGGRQ
jgi:putative DNA primase/helicase